MQVNVRYLQNLGNGQYLLIQKNIKVLLEGIVIMGNYNKRRGYAQPLCIIATKYKVLRVVPQNEEQLLLLQDIILKEQEIDVWRAPSAVNSTVDLNLSPNSFENIITELKANDIYYEVIIEDVQQAIYKQQKIVSRQISVMEGNDLDYGKYHTLEQINDWVQSMAMKYKPITTIFNFTNSYEGRPLLELKISSQSEIERKGFWLEGGIHAREWIAPATLIYMAGYILDHYKSDPEMNALLDMFDWYIVPVVNTDGYEYTWSKMILCAQAHEW